MYIDLKEFFEKYPIVSKKLAEQMGMNYTYLSQITNNCIVNDEVRVAKYEDLLKIQKAVNELGRKLARLKFVDD